MYILANYIYNYDPTNQILRNSGSKALLKLDKDGKLLVIGRDLGNVKDGNGIVTWTYLTECDIIEENQVWYQDRNISRYVVSSEYTGTYESSYFGYRQIGITSNNVSYHAYNKDLLNWATLGSKKNIAMAAPRNYNSWQGSLALEHFHNVYFKGKLYVLGVGKFANGYYKHDNYPTRNFRKINVIDWGKDGNNINNWHSLGYPDNQPSYINVFLYKKPIGWDNSTGERIYEEKLYMRIQGNYYYYQDGDKYSYGT